MIGSANGRADKSLPLDRIRLAYFWRFGRIPDVANPRLFTEWVQWRKLFDRSAHHPALMDKLAAKRTAQDALGRAWIIPTLWSGGSLPPAPPVHGHAMLKARHGCNQHLVLRDTADARRWRRAARRAARWCRQPYGHWLGEWAYRDVPRGAVLEPFVSDTGALPVDYKIYVFRGVATHVQVHLGRGRNHRWILHDRHFVPLVHSAERIAPPRSLSAMLVAAEALAAENDFLRVDFYEVGGQPLFGEFCLYPGSGLDPFAADWIDAELGALWRSARLAAVAEAAPGRRILPG